MQWWRRILRILIFFGAGFLVIVLVCNLWVVSSTSNLIARSANGVPLHSVGLVLGTSHRMQNGSPNPFFQNRIAMAASLYQSGRVVHFLLSGDNRSKYYNEPLEMKKALVELGVPDTAITLDVAGLRTLDSIVRSKEIFGQDRIVIITQPFHCYRALFISRYYDIDAMAVTAVEPGQEASISVYLRVYFARTKAVMDFYVLGTEPEQLGTPEPLNI
ncbi:MAG: YdcF family protein [Cyclobacteriaceae bacterium]|nr:YdcF family protein [Cyclobacteriaceae bacterium]